MALVAKSIRDNLVANVSAVKKWRERGENVFEIAKRFGRSVSWVKQRLLLLKLDPALYPLLAGSNDEPPGRRLSVQHALLLTALPVSEQAKMARLIVDKKMSLLAARQRVLALKVKLQPDRPLYLHVTQQLLTLRSLVARCRQIFGYHLALPGAQFDRLFRLKRRHQQSLLDELKLLASDLAVLIQSVESSV